MLFEKQHGVANTAIAGFFPAKSNQTPTFTTSPRAPRSGSVRCTRVLGEPTILLPLPFRPVLEIRRPIYFFVALPSNRVFQVVPSGDISNLKL
jgi:hypothetical protein